MKLLLAVVTIIGTVIGAGVLGLPYAISLVGFVPGVIITLILSACMTLLLLYLGEIVLRCREVYQLPGLVRKYFNNKWYFFTLFLFIVSVYGALISYVIGVSSVINSLFSLNELIIGLIFVGMISVPIILGVHLMDKVQLVLVGLLVSFIIFISLSIMPEVSVSNLIYNNWGSWFKPFGVLLFALTGYSVIPELELILLKHERLFSKAVVISMVSVVLIYLLFAYSFIGVYGSSVSEVATESLTGLLGLFGNIVAVFGMTTSFLGLGVALFDVFNRDVGFNKFYSWLLTCVAPLFFAFSFKLSFIQPIMISGAYTTTLIGLIIIGLWFKARSVRGVKPAFTAPLGITGALIVGLVLIVTIIVTSINLAPAGAL